MRANDFATTTRTPRYFGGERRVLAARALAVVAAGHDDAAALPLCARAGSSGSIRRNTKRAIAATFDRKAITSAPSGERSPVETSSPTTMSTAPETASGSGACTGGGWMFGPRMTSDLRRFRGGRRRDDLSVVRFRPAGHRRESALPRRGRADR